MYNYQIMSNSFGYIDIILLGMIAGFIILRLRSILGRKTGHESKVYPGFTKKEAYKYRVNFYTKAFSNRKFSLGKDMNDMCSYRIWRIA